MNSRVNSAIKAAAPWDGVFHECLFFFQAWFTGNEFSAKVNTLAAPQRAFGTYPTGRAY